MSRTLDIAIYELEKRGVEFVDVLFTSISGRTHMLSIPVSEVEDAVKGGVGFDGSSVGFIGVEESDLLLKPDPSTLRVVEKNSPSGKPMAIMIGNIFRGESRYELDPRYILEKKLRELEDTISGAVYMIAPEIEFWLFIEKGDDVVFQDRASYMYPPPSDRGYDIRIQIARTLTEAGIKPVKIHHEVPPAKHEVDFQFSDALHTADNTIIYKYLVRRVAASKGLIASFMPKPFHGTYGAGMHTHQSLYNVIVGENLFHGSEIYGLSKIALYFIGGLLKYAKAITLATNPTVNSYKRLVPGWEAPVYISWARYNRSALIRVPMASSPRAKRIEYRATDGSTNPYLAYSAMLHSGLVGIKEKIEPPDPCEENVYAMSTREREEKGIEVLPSNLGEAIREALREPILEHAWGREAFEKYLEFKRKEWFEFSTTVHKWERDKYLEFF